MIYIYTYLSSSIIREKHPGLTLLPSYCWGDGYDARLQEVVSLKTPLLMNISIKLKVCITQPSHPLPIQKRKKKEKKNIFTNPPFFQKPFQPISAPTSTPTFPGKATSSPLKPDAATTSSPPP